jgi:hypothetical protein
VSLARKIDPTWVKLIDSKRPDQYVLTEEFMYSSPGQRFSILRDNFHVIGFLRLLLGVPSIYGLYIDDIVEMCRYLGSVVKPNIGDKYYGWITIILDMLQSNNMLENLPGLKEEVRFFVGVRTISELYDKLSVKNQYVV